jgi:hypothetical protein
MFKFSIAERVRFDADPVPNFYVDADPDLHRNENDADPHADPTQGFTRQSKYFFFF